MFRKIIFKLYLVIKFLTSVVHESFLILTNQNGKSVNTILMMATTMKLLKVPTAKVAIKAMIIVAISTIETIHAINVFPTLMDVLG